MKALLIPVHGPPRAVELAEGEDNRLMRSIRAHIGAECAERIWITGQWEAWLDEDGAASGQPVNQSATHLAHAFSARFSLRGTVVITGLAKDKATPAPPSPAQVEVMLRRIRTP